MTGRGRSEDGSWSLQARPRPPFDLPRTVSVVICAYTERRWDSLVNAIESVRVQKHHPAQVIVVIDHNEDLLRRARAAFPGDVEVVASEEDTGLSGARNTGVRVAWGDVVAFLDDDAVAEPDWLQELVAHYRPHVAGAGGVALPVWPGSARPGWFPQEFDWVVGCSYRGLPDTVAPQRNLIGAAMSFRRLLFDEVGYFDTAMGRIGTLPLGCEETEFALRVRETFTGTELVHVPFARVHHHVAAERTKIWYFLRRCHARVSPRQPWPSGPAASTRWPANASTSARHCPRESLTACEPACVATPGVSPGPS